MILQKKLAAKILKCSPKRIVTTPSKDIKEAITKSDVKKLIQERKIKKIQKKGSSKSRTKKIREQKKKGRRKGQGSRKGKTGARTNKKRTWINKIRAQRKLLKRLKEKKLLTNKDFQIIYKKSKGGFFRSVNHIKLYLGDKGIIK